MKTRGLLEPLKFVAPRELLLAVSLVCRQWSAVAAADEVWRVMCEAAGFRGTESWKAAYKAGWMMAGHVVFLWRGEIALYDCRTDTLKSSMRLQKPIEAMEGTSHSFLPDCDVLVCGGGSIKSSFPFAWQVSPYNGAVARLQSMKRPRKYHGIVLFHDTIFVFGGTHSLRVLSSVEAYVGATWQIIGKMKTARTAFQPCISNNLVYLAGGQTTKIETFDPEKVTFTELPLQLSEASRSSAFLYDNQILILTSYRLSELSNSLRTLQIWDPTNYENSGDSRVTVVKGGAFFPVANWSVLVKIYAEQTLWKYREVHLSTLRS
jgi:hypothetical protein